MIAQLLEALGSLTSGELERVAEACDDKAKLLRALARERAKLERQKNRLRDAELKAPCGETS